MTKFFLLPIALAAIATPVLAETVATPFSFNADGQTFTVMRVDTSKGAILSGTDSSNNRFRLEVVGKHVSGVYGSGTVSFDIAAPIAQPQIAMQ